MKAFLKLPPDLRRQALQYVQHSPSAFGRRTFSNGCKLLERRIPKPSPKKPLPQSSQVPPRPVVPPQADFRGEASYLDSLFRGSDKVLIYASPKHNSLYASSYLIGLSFIFGAYSWAQFALKERPVEDGQPGSKHKMPWYLKSVLAAEILIVAGLGTHFLLAPSSLVKSITLVKAAAASSSSSLPATASKMPLVRFEIRRGLPFLKPDVLETTPDKITLDKNVKAMGPSLKTYNVPLEQAQQFTSEYFSAKMRLSSQQRGIYGHLRSIWPAIRRETGRMFLRENMAYVNSKDHGKFKVDMQGAVVLDSGRPLTQVIPVNSELSEGLFGRIARFLGYE